MFTPHRDRGRSPISTGPRLVEWLESRTLLSAAAGWTAHPNVQVLQHAAVGAPVDGYSPAQIRHAYGFDQVNFGNVPADGRGQTIAIVDAYDNPNITSDLKVFDQQYGLPDPPSFKILGQTGTPNRPATEPGWAGEIALDVEWVHATAPAAKLLLIEASSFGRDDLLTAVDLARQTPGVNVVSMSWGGGEALDWGGKEFVSQTGYDHYFTTPPGHSNVTFVVSSGDFGQAGGALWPSTAPTVLAVGGTTLQTADSAGTYASEGAWDGSSGGYSFFEPEPAFQSSVQSTRYRSTPDVALNADPQTGFAVYDSVPDSDGNSGWEVVGGTSASAPIWAALLGIVNQGRAQAGKAPLDGPTQTLPLLYSWYNTTNSAGAANYPIYFNDTPIGPGYDTATGLGSPKVPAVIPAMVAAKFPPPSSTGTGGSGGSGGSGGTGSNGGAPGEVIGDGSGSGPTGGGSGSTQTPTPTPSPTPTPTAPPPPSPVKAVFAPSLPPSMIAGQDGGLLKLRLTNTGGYRYAGPVNVTVFASADAIVSSDDATIATASLPQASFRPRASKKLKLNLSFPSTLPDGAYYFVAQVAATDTQTTPAVTATSSAMQIAPGHVDLAATFGGTPISVDPGRKVSTTVSIQNLGNVTAAGPLDLGLYASSDDQYDPLDELLAQLPTHTLHLKPGRSIKLHLHFTAPTDQTAGSYSLLAVMKPAASLGDSDSSNDVAVAATV
jgi:hypothetical protein